ncbi:MAG: hypothetical protein ACE5QW_05970 [Thermoplasmata archaeon]
MEIERVVAEGGGAQGPSFRRFRATVRDRILIHLLDYTKHRHLAEAPFETTQAGIAEVISALRSHVSMVLASLIDLGMVEERLSHIGGEVRRKKAYFLTSKGLSEAEQTREKFLKTPVVVYVDGNMEEVEIGDIDEILGGTYYLVDILVSVDETGVLDLEALTGQKAETTVVFTAPLVGVSCPQCLFNFLVQAVSGVKDSYTICPSCSNTIPLAGQVLGSPKTEELHPPSTGPILAAASVLVIAAALHVVAPWYFCGISLAGLLLAVVLLAAGYPALREDSRQTRMAILAFFTSLGLYLAITLKIFLTHTLEPILFAYSLYVMGPFFALVLVPRPIPKRYREELAMAGGVFLSIIGVVIAFLPSFLPWTEYHAIIWLLLGSSAFMYGYENARPVENMRELLFAGTGASMLVLVVIAFFLAFDSISALEALVAGMWFALGVLLLSTRILPSTSTKGIGDTLLAALPLCLGVLFVLLGALVLMQQLFVEGGLELLVGAPLIWWGLASIPRSNWKMWVIIFAYIMIAELLSFWTFFRAPA